jgi:hypothetical protein
MRGLHGVAQEQGSKPHARLRSGDDVGVTGLENVIVESWPSFLKHEGLNEL